MKIESTAFEAADVLQFVNDLRERERRELAGRLQAVDERLRALGPRLEAGAATSAGEEAWNAREVLAHMSVLSKFYGVMAYQIATGKLTRLDLLEQVRMRDVAGEMAAGMAPAELIEALSADHQRTIKFLEGVAPEDLSRRADTCLPGLGEMSAYEVLKLPLVGHLEAHLEQLESALG